MDRRRVRLSAPIAVTLLFLAIQLVAARFVVTSLSSPNAATTIGRTLARTGAYTCDDCATRLYGRDGVKSRGALLMFHLPGEPLFLAASFRLLPGGLLRYIHLPFALLLIFSATWVARELSGPVLSVMTGIVACLEPFFVLHGLTWDDTFLGAALDWAVFALLLNALREQGGNAAAASPVSWKRPARIMLIALLAGYASITRTSSWLVLPAVCLCAVFMNYLRPVRMEGLAAIAGMCLALAAWGYRNDSVLGEFAIGTSHDGITLWESVYPSAREALLTRGKTEELNDERMKNDFARTSSMGELDANRYFLGRARRYLIAEPVDVARTAITKVAVDLSGLKLEEPLLSARNIVGLVSNMVLLALAFAGAIRLRLPAHRGQLLLWRAMAWSSVLVYAGLSIVGPIGLRYRISLEPVLWICAGACLCRIAARFGLLRLLPILTHDARLTKIKKGPVAGALKLID